MLALEWTNKRIRVVEGSTQGESVRLSSAFVVDLPDSVEGSDAVGAFIRSELSRRKIRERRAVACIDRRNVVLKVVNVADIAESEIPTTVRLQAMRDLTLPLEETTVDYMRTNPQNSEEEPQVVVAVVRNEIVSNYQRVFKSAGLRLEGLWPASLAHVRAAMSAIPTMITHAGEEHFLIVPYPDSVELSLLRGTRFLTSASRPVSRTATPGGEVEPLLQTVKRLQASLSGQYSDVKIQSVLVAGEREGDELTQGLQEQFGAEIIYFDPLRQLAEAGVEHEERGAFAGVVGSLVVADRPTDQRVNFLLPKKPKPKTDYRRAAMIVGVGAAVMGILLANRYRAVQQDVLDRAIKSANAKKAERSEKLKEIQIKVDELAWVKDWYSGETNWLNLMRDLATQLPESEKFFLTKIELAETGASTGTKAVVKLDGYADDPTTINQLNSRLTNELGVLVDPGAIQPSPRHARYAWKYDSTVSVPADWQGRESGAGGGTPTIGAGRSRSTEDQP